jgi:hypothetical protein
VTGAEDLKRLAEETHVAIIRAKAKMEYADEIAAHSKAWKRQWRNWLVPVYTGLVLALSVWAITAIAPELALLWAIVIGVTIAYCIMVAI